MVGDAIPIKKYDEIEEEDFINSSSLKPAYYALNNN